MAPMTIVPGRRLDPIRAGFRFPNRFDALDLLWPGKASPMVYGLCGGMCFAVLDLFYAGQSVPAASAPPSFYSPLYRYLLLRQLDSLALRALAKIISWTLQDNARVARRTVQEEIPRIRASLDAGRPAALVLIRIRGVNLTANHQVLAVNYTLEQEAEQLAFTLYDPNHPGRAPQILAGLGDPARGTPFRQSTGEPLRGFFMLDYRWKKPPVL